MLDLRTFNPGRPECPRDTGRIGRLSVLLLLAIVALGTTFAAPGSDEFDVPGLDTDLWTFIDPLNDSSLDVSGGRVTMTAAPGVLHYTWTGINTTPRIMQDAADEDFELEAKFDSDVTLPYQLQGFRIEADLDNSLVVQLSSSGAGTLLIYGQVTNGIVSAPVAVPLPNGAPSYLRVLRQGNVFTMSHSLDGVNFNVAATVSRAMAVSSVGLMVGNYSNGNPPAHTAVVDYFRKRVAPSVDVAPTSVAVVEPNPATFQVLASGDGPLAYQWRRNGSDLAGETGSSLTIDPTTVADDGARFDVVITNAVGSVVTAEATLNVTPAPTPPSILTEPADAAIFEGASATFQALASGAAPLSYQWRRNGVDIAGATGTSYTITGASLADDGAQFDVVVTNGLGSVISRSALLSVSPAPATDAPNDEFNAATLDTDLWSFINPLNDATLSMTGSQVSIAIPAGSSHFTWSGINTIPRIMQDAEDGNFELEAEFDSSVTVGYQMQGLRIEQDLNNSLSVQFNHNGATSVLVYGNVFNGVAERPTEVAVPGGAPTFLRVLREGDDWTVSYSTNGTVWTVAHQFQRSMTVNSVGLLAGNYAVVGLAPAHTMLVDRFTRRDLPGIVTQPADVTVEAPDAAAFSVVAGGVGPFTYQWRRDGVAIAGATGTTYTLDPTSAADDGAEFDVIVSNADGDVTSAAATLFVGTGPTPPPVASDDSYQAPFFGTLDTLVSGLPSVLDNDTHPTNATLTATLTSDVSNGTLTLFPDGSFQYEHNGNDTSIQELLPAAGNSLLEYGVDTAVDGDVLIVGSNANEGIGTKAGAAYVFRRNGMTWEYEAKLVPNGRIARQWFGWTVDVQGNTVVIGAPGEPHVGQWAGAAYVFEYDGSNWAQTARLVAPDAQTLDEFGNAVRIDGDTIAIGAYLDDAGLQENSGSVYMFDRDGSNWTLTQKLAPSAPVFDGWFGFDIDLEGDRLAVGSNFDDELGLDAGAVFMYERDNGSWVMTDKILADDGAATDTFGFAVSLDGDTLAVGANHHVDGFGPAERGAAYVFEYDGSDWNQIRKIDGPNFTTYGIFRFGLTLSLEGDTLAIGGHDDGPSPNAGAVYVYDRDGGAWTFDRKLNSPAPTASEEFGADVIVSGNLIIVGASTKKYSFLPDTAAGTAYTFEIGGDLLDSFRYVADDGQQTSGEATVEIYREP